MYEEEEKTRSYISLFLFVATFFYFWRNSLVTKLKNIDEAFRSMPDAPMPFGSSNEDDDEEDEDADLDPEDKLAKLQAEIKAGLAAAGEQSNTVYDLSSITWTTIGLLFKTFILSLLLFIVLSFMQSTVISPLFITKDPVQFKLVMPKIEPKTSFKDKLKNINFKFLKAKPKSQALIDTFPAHVRVSKEYLEDGKYDSEGYGFLLYTFQELSYVLIAALFCTFMTHFYVKYCISQKYMNSKSYVKSQVRVIYTINIIMFYVIFFGLMII